MIQYIIKLLIFMILMGGTAMAETPDDTAEIPEGAARLISAYPDQQMTYRDNYIIFPDGASFIYDDRREKTFEEKLDESDIEDMFSLIYPGREPKYLEDGGRSRCDALFKKMYGASSKEVKKNLVTVKWFGENLKFTKINGAAEQLRAVAEELAKMPQYKSYMKSSGTFNWRKVRGAHRMSAHSYGYAIDIAVPYSDYWQWKYKKAGETDQIGYKNRIPMEIVEVFEKHGFIWGGYWYHFDTMHFEYRPEILHRPTEHIGQTAEK